MHSAQTAQIHSQLIGKFAALENHPIGFTLWVDLIPLPVLVGVNDIGKLYLAL
jgi:hypothetical protein